MDGNSSGSMQSSSGDEDEYDSRAESSSSFSTLFLNNNPPQIGPFSTTSGGDPPNSSSSHNLSDPLAQHHTPIFNPLLSSYYLDHPTQRPNSSTTTTATSLIPSNHPISLDMIWSSKSLDGSKLNQSNFGTMMQVGMTQNSGSAVGVAAFPTTIQPHPLPPRQQAQNNNNNNGVRNPKKRSRASRRAPTTVLTTDTTNFRAMVQEFTGIPAPPFTSSPFPRTRLDLFGNSVTPSSASTPIRSNNLEPRYLLRPFAQKVQPFSNPSSSSSTPISFPLVPNSSSSMVDTLLANNNNTIFSFNSILQAPQQKYPPSHLASKTPQTNSTNTIIDSSLKVGVFEELGLMSHAHVNNTAQVGGALHHHHHHMVHSSSDGALLSRINNNNNDGGDHGGGVIRSPLISNIQDRVSNGKVNNYNSDFIHGGEEGPECGVTATARSEGMVESWINCSSSD